MYKTPIMQSIYLQQLVVEIKNHDVILENELLAKNTWSKRSFIECSKVIGATLLSEFSRDELLSYGTSISYKTLETICKHRYKLKKPLDRRCLITLTKLAKFIGYDSWAEFTQSVDSMTIQFTHLPCPREMSNQLA